MTPQESQSMYIIPGGQKTPELVLFISYSVLLLGYDDIFTFTKYLLLSELHMIALNHTSASPGNQVGEFFAFSPETELGEPET